MRSLAHLNVIALLHLPIADWELTGTVTVSRGDGAMSDLGKVRFVVDFVKDTRLPVSK